MEALPGTNMCTNIHIRDFEFMDCVLLEIPTMNYISENLAYRCAAGQFGLDVCMLRAVAQQLWNG